MMLRTHIWSQEANKTNVCIFKALTLLN